MLQREKLIKFCKLMNYVAAVVTAGLKQLLGILSLQRNFKGFDL
jgi:hypothetical protein